jgi:hypothetical protein
MPWLASDSPASRMVDRHLLSDLVVVRDVVNQGGRSADGRMIRSSNPNYPRPMRLESGIPASSKPTAGPIPLSRTTLRRVALVRTAINAPEVLLCNRYA